MPIRYYTYQIITAITSEGWYPVGTKGSHHKFKHPQKPGIVVIPHQKASILPGTASQILKASGCEKILH